MATFTEHYDLIKPGTDDYYDVADFNENMDTIDTQLYQAEQDMAGVSEKIGNPGDQGTDTIFGLLHPDNQPEDKADFYRYSKTDIKKKIQNWTVLATGSSIQDFYAKLTTIHAEKNGTVYIKINTTDLGTIGLGVYDKLPVQAVEAADQSRLVGLKGYSKKNSEAWFLEDYNINSASRTEEREWIIPVEAGKDYTLLYIGSNAREAILNEFILSYTDTKEA